MTNKIRMSEDGLQHLMIKEGDPKRPGKPMNHAWFDTNGQKWTIGFGRTRDVKKGMYWDDDKSLQELKKDVAHQEKYASGLVKTPLDQDRQDALLNFTYNADGLINRDEDNYGTQTQFLKKLNAGDVDGAFLVEMPRWVHAKGAKGEVHGLKNRRKSDIDFGYRNVEGYVPFQYPDKGPYDREKQEQNVRQWQALRSQNAQPKESDQLGGGFPSPPYFPSHDPGVTAFNDSQRFTFPMRPRF